MNVLILDDDPFVLRLMSYQLETLGLRNITACQEGMDALSLLEGEDRVVDLIVLDLQMPKMDGVEFMRHLVRLQYNGSLLLVSGEDERILHTAEKLSRAHNLNVLGALHKPISPDQFKQVLGNHTRRAAVKPEVGDKNYTTAELRRALLNDELINHYQPKVDLRSGRLVGVESLVRWQHPLDGLVYPDQFIREAEESTLIDDLTHTVLRQALRDARCWLDQRMSLHVSVNVSMENLKSLNFPDRVVLEAKAAKVPLKHLVLELTESRLMNNLLTLMDIFTRLRLKHISLSIDDFGTGHSSLVQLRDLPFDELKVDRGFVHGACLNPSLRAIYQASVVMAAQLGMTSVAEGVEDQDDWEFLQANGGDLAQGYFIARPMPAEALQDWLAVWESRRLQLIGTRS